MGYTHYWTRPATIPQSQWDAFTNDVRAILASLPQRTSTAGGYYADAPLALADWDGKSAPVVTDSDVRFNGAGEELSHESFTLSRIGERRDFCKTARKPYDVVVVAVLTALAARVRRATWSSDGDASDHAEGIALYQSATRNV